MEMNTCFDVSRSVESDKINWWVGLFKNKIARLKHSMWNYNSHNILKTQFKALLLTVILAKQYLEYLRPAFEKHDYFTKGFQNCPAFFTPSCNRIACCTRHEKLPHSNSHLRLAPCFSCSCLSLQHLKLSCPKIWQSGCLSDELSREECVWQPSFSPPAGCF